MLKSIFKSTAPLVVFIVWIFAALTAQASTAVAAAGQRVTFSVGVAGTAPFTYQWYKNGTAIGTATGVTHVIAAVSLSDAGTYTVEVTNGVGSTTSDDAVLTVVIPSAPTITAHPSSRTIDSGADTTFSVTAASLVAMTYQWYYNGAAISGATSSSYTLSNATTANAGAYTVTVGNSAGSTPSNPAILTVNPAAPVINSATVAGAALTVPFSYAITGTDSPTSFSASGLPGGLSLNTSTGVISGTPTATGSFTVTLGATNAGGTGSATLTLSVVPATTAATFAGSTGTAGSADGTGTAASFRNPSDVNVDSAGNLFVADTDNHTVRKITSGGVTTTFAGLALTPGSTDATGTAARFNAPGGVAADGSGNLYVADTDNHAIRKITVTGVVTTFAGLSGNAGTANGTGTAARFNFPSDLGIDSAGNLYIADTGNHAIRKITPAGVVTTFAGSPGTAGTANGTGTAARFNAPSDLALDSSGTLFVADTNNHTVRKITSSGVVTTLAGSAGNAGSADGLGAAARFNFPSGITVAADGNLYVSDTSNHTVRALSPVTNVVITILGQAGTAGTANGSGSAARLSSPMGLSGGSGSTVYFADSGSHRIRSFTINPVPVILAQPQSVTVSPGASFTLTVAASGAGLAYQWRKNGAAISGATSASYAVSSAITADAGTYSVVVSNAGGSATSNNATVTLTAGPGGDTGGGSGGPPAAAASGGGSFGGWALAVMALLGLIRAASRRSDRDAA